MSTLHNLPERPQAEDENDIRRTHFAEDVFIDEWVEDYTGECSFCGKPLELPALMWKMFSGTMWLHAKCCQNLGLNLLKDVARMDYVHKSQVTKAVAKLTV